MAQVESWIFVIKVEINYDWLSSLRYKSRGARLTDELGTRGNMILGLLQVKEKIG